MLTTLLKNFHHAKPALWWSLKSSDAEISGPVWYKTQAVCVELSGHYLQCSFKASAVKTSSSSRLGWMMEAEEGFICFLFFLNRSVGDEGVWFSDTHLSTAAAAARTAAVVIWGAKKYELCVLDPNWISDFMQLPWSRLLCQKSKFWQCKTIMSVGNFLQWKQLHCIKTMYA